MASNTCSAHRRLVIWVWLFAITSTAFQPSLWAQVEAEAASSESSQRSQREARLIWLRAEIARHDELYFKKAAPEISDAEYDRLKREMRMLEKALPQVASASAQPASALGDDHAGAFSTYRHREPMLSLEKAYTETELRAFISRVQSTLRRDDLVWVVEPKFDGLAISVTYENGRLVRAVTRGNGQRGDDVTANVLTITSVPRQLPAGSPDVVEVRGEVYIDYTEFARINAEREEAGEELFAHPRNLAAGTLKQKDPAEVAKRKLSAVFYGLGAWVGTPAAPATQQALHALLKAWALPGVTAPVVASNADDVWLAVQRFGHERDTLSFPTDGAVVKIDSRAVQQELGASNEAPRWAVAYKFPPERVTTRLRAITLQVGRTGVVTPVAELEPVRIDGTTISRATLHNSDEIARRDLRVGDWVMVEKAGEIIPAITGVDLSRRAPESVAFVFPMQCASCGTKLVRVDGEAAVKCPNWHCPAQLRRRIEHFAAPTGVGIDNLGPTLIETLVASGKVGSVADLYRLKPGDGVTASILAEIERSKRAELARFIFGLGLPGVGRKKAEELAQRYGSLAALAQSEDLPQENRLVMTELVALGVNPQMTVKVPSGPLAGKTVVLTGTLPGWSRAEATQLIEAAGGKVATGVSKRTDLVVVGDGAGAKLTEARALGITVIDEVTLRSLLEKK